jgi:predicted RNA-binding Zn ribbon-like protein
MTEPAKADVAPGRLETVRQFVNTSDLEDGTDEIASPPALGAWLEQHGFGPATVSDADVAAFHDAREGLRALLLANNGEALDRGAVARLDELARSVDLRVRFAPESRLEPAAGGTAAAALGELLATVHASMGDGTWARLKACRASDCQWAFYDHSRNRSGTWCSMEVCGNRAKARNFRARHGSHD